MKFKLFSIALIFVVILGSTPSSIQAQSNNTLEWGVEIGEEFTYVLQRAQYSDPMYKESIVYSGYSFVKDLEIGQKAILRVDTLPEIPSQINESPQMPLASCTMIRANDSTVIATNVNTFIIPIGDWEFLSEMSNLTNQEGVTPIDTANEWGMKVTTSYTEADGSVITITSDLRLEKENGTLNYLRWRFSTQGLSLIDIIFVNWHPGMPTVLMPGIQISTLLIISTGVVVGLIISIFIYTRIRKRKSLVQQLGE